MEDETASLLAEMKREPLGERLRRLRKLRGLTQAQVAGSAYSAAYISSLEAGRRQPSGKAIAFLADSLGVDSEELLTGLPPQAHGDLRIRLQEAFEELYEGRYEAAKDLFSSMAEEAEGHDLHRLQARAEEGRATALERAGDVSAAERHFQAALEILNDQPAPTRAEAIAGLARCAQMKGEIRYAVHLLESHLLLLEREGLRDPLAMMRIHSSLIWPLSELALHQQAAEAAAKALRLQPKVEEQEQIASMYLNVARELFRQGLSEDALDSLRRAEDIYRVLNWKTELARAHGNKAIVLAEQGDFDAARLENREALKLLEGTSSKLTQARALNELARVERLSGHIEEAKSALGDAIELLGDIDVGELAFSYRELGLCNKEENHLDLAEKNIRNAISLYRRADSFQQVARTYRHLGDIMCERGRLDSGREAYREGLMALDDPRAA